MPWERKDTMLTKLFRSLLGCGVAALLCSSMAFGQTVTGSITGTVTDPSGAVVAGAVVNAGNIATGVHTTATTNGAGVYTIRFLPIGNYELSVEAKGFATANVAPFPLEIDQTAKVDVKMTISTATTVEVKETIHPILNTTDSTLGNTLTTREIENVPLNGRNFSSLTLYQPGAVATDPTGLTGNNATERNTYNSGVVTVNGNRQQANNYMVEGADNNEPQNNLIAYNPAPDAIGELRVVSANANATYGNANGGAIVTVLKSGTNQFHGSAYGLLEDQKLDANAWKNGLTDSPKTKYTQTIFGGAFGGSIIRNKLFFFGDYEGVRKHSAQQAQQASVLTPAMLQGDFSALLAPGIGIQLYDSQNNFAPYLNNHIPVTNPVAQYLAAHPEIYPAPNRTPTDGLIQNDYVGPQGSKLRNNQGDVKIDYNLSNSDKLNGFYSQGTGKDFTSAVIPVFFPAHNRYPTKITGLSWVHTFSPTIVNEVRFGFTRVRWLNGVPSDPSGLFGTSGNQKVGIPFPGTQTYEGFTGQSLNNNASYIGTSANPQIFTDNTFNYQDTLTWQRGRHYISLGAQATRYQQNYINTSNVGFLGTFNYSGQFTAPPSGQGYGPADFVLGRIQNVQLASPLSWVGQRQWRVATFIQDDFKLRPKLTINLGLRYQYDQPWYEQHDKTANVLPGGIVEYAHHIPAGAVAGATICPTEACYNANYTQFMPRIGAAYQITNKLVIRGGYGASSFFEGYSFNQRLTSSPPFSLAINSNAVIPAGTSGGTPFTVSNAFSQPFGINNSLYSVWPQNVQPAYIHQMTLVTEYALTNELSLTVGYHGQIGHHLADYRNGNQLTAQQSQDLNGNCGAANIPAADRTPYYNLVGECNPILVTESRARMTYHAGQVTLRQRLHHGLEYTLNYTYSKSLTNSSGNYAVSGTSFNGSSMQDGYNLEADYGPSGMDIRHSMNFVGVYDLPFGHGRPFGGNASGFVNAALGGWKMAASGILYSGFPVTIFGPCTSNTNSWGFCRANQYRPLVVHDRTIQHWWGTDPSAMPCENGVDNGVCAYGIAGSNMFGTARNSTQRGPNYRQVDLSLFKDFHLWSERHVIGFRADFFNVFNIASYALPDSGVTDHSWGLISDVRSPARQTQLSLHYTF